MLLAEHLSKQPFTLTMSCTFFGFFAHSGALLALLEEGLYPSKVMGSSAGAVVAGMHAAGYTPDEMFEQFIQLSFSDIFSFCPTVYGGFPYVCFFKQRMEFLEDRILDGDRPKRIEDCKIPLSISVYDATDSKRRVMTRGRLSTAIAASAAVPFLMHGVYDDDDGHRLVDAGVGGDMLGISGADPQDTILCINLFVRAFLPQLPHHLPKAIVVDLFGVPFCAPSSLQTTGPEARLAAYNAMKRALKQPVHTYSSLGPQRIQVHALS